MHALTTAVWFSLENARKSGSSLSARMARRMQYSAYEKNSNALLGCRGNDSASAALRGRRVAAIAARNAESVAWKSSADRRGVHTEIDLVCVATEYTMWSRFWENGVSYTTVFFIAEPSCN